MPQVEKLKTFSKSAFIFDLDGTLFDSATQISDAVNSTRTILGYLPLTLFEARKLIGLPAEALFSDLKLESLALERAVKAFRIALSKLVRQRNPIYPGALHLLSDLRARGAFIGVATSKPQELAELVITHSELNGLFNYIQGTGELRPKPYPDTIVACLEHANSTHGVMIGDRVEDILAGNRAGVMTIGVSQSAHSSKQLLEAGAQYVFKSLEDLYLGIDKLPEGRVWTREVL